MADDAPLEPPPRAIPPGPRAASTAAGAAVWFAAVGLVVAFSDAGSGNGVLPAAVRWILALGCLALVASAIRTVHRTRVQRRPVIAFAGDTMVVRSWPWRDRSVRRGEIVEVGVRDRRGRFGTRSTTLLVDVTSGRGHLEVTGTMFGDVYAAERAIRAWASGLDPLTEER